MAFCAGGAWRTGGYPVHLHDLQEMLPHHDHHLSALEEVPQASGEGLVPRFCPKHIYQVLHEEVEEEDGGLQVLAVLPELQVGQCPGDAPEGLSLHLGQKSPSPSLTSAVWLVARSSLPRAW